MKKFTKYLPMALLAGSLAWLNTSCDDSKDNDAVQEYTGGPGIYFSTTENSYLELSEDASTITYYAYRDEAGEEVTVPVEVTPVENYEVDDIYTFPSSITFPAGSKVGEFVIGYDISKAELGVEQQYQLTMDAEPTPFSTNTIIITLVNPAPWDLLGTNGQYWDYGWYVTETSPGPAKISVWQQGVDKNKFRISNPYFALNEEEDLYFEFQLLQVGDYFYGEVTEPDLVGYTQWFIEFLSDYGDDIYFVYPGCFASTNANRTYCRVLEYQDNGLPGYIQLSGSYYMFNEGGWNYTADPTVYILFPDFILLDTSLEAVYEGILTPDSQEQEVLLSVTLGEDITEARAAVAPGEDYEALIEAIKEGTIEYTTFNSSGNVHIPFGNDNETGNYVAAVVGYVNDEAKASEYVEFFYISSSSEYDPNEGWNSLGYVEYTDGFVCSLYFTDLTTYEVEIQESESNPGLYRLVNPYGEIYPWNVDGDYKNGYFYLYINAINPEQVYIPESPQALDWGYGQLVCYSKAGYNLDNGVAPDVIASQSNYFGTLADNKITFNFSTLLVSEGDDGPYGSNLVLDYDKYEEGISPWYLEDEDGEYVAPFCVDLNTISSTPSATAVSRSYATGLTKPIKIQSTRKKAELTKLSTKKDSRRIDKAKTSPMRESFYIGK